MSGSIKDQDDGDRNEDNDSDKEAAVTAAAFVEKFGGGDSAVSGKTSDFRYVLRDAVSNEIVVSGRRALMWIYVT